ncbi:MAG TPA: tRNA (adenosine(37)-N6)-dimethylallyltransferase MiaA [Usitatibacter sp.]|nr:tRNA (adenosine(37)-N6)-dimethylallyltransferase MiaA [Usitatibacter sp.]
MKAIFLLGPTASGKTAVALELAKHMPVEIVSVDSAQVYRGMDVGTAKPAAHERAGVPHHLIDVVEPTEAFSAGRFRDAALALVPEIHARGRIPLLVGGTMLYFRTLTRGLADLPAAHPGLRAEIEARAAREGWAALHAELAAVDPQTARRLLPTDAQRIQRALEVHRVTGRALSELHALQPPQPLPFEALRISLEPGDRAVLHRRIHERFRAMIAAGLLEELEGLRARHALHAQLPSMRSVGYRQAWEVLEGAAPRESLEARGSAATRQLAKRQLTWLRAMPDVERFDCLAPGLAASVLARAESFLTRRRGT